MNKVVQSELEISRHKRNFFPISLNETRLQGITVVVLSAAKSRTCSVECKVKKVKLYLNRVAHSALRLESIGALYLKKLNYIKEFHELFTFKKPNKNMIPCRRIL